MALSIQNYITSVIYFKGITAEELMYITDNSTLCTYIANEIIFLEGETAKGLWIVESGYIKIYKLSPDGNEHILHLRDPGKTFNDIGALDGDNNPANAALSKKPDVRLYPQCNPLCSDTKSTAIPYTYL